jgi:hypothetical protein
MVYFQAWHLNVGKFLKVWKKLIYFMAI